MSQRKIERDGSYTIREIVKVVAISLSRMYFIVKLFGFFFYQIDSAYTVF